MLLIQESLNESGSLCTFFNMCGFTGKWSIVGILDLDPFRMKANKYVQF